MNDIVIYQSPDDNIEVSVKLNNDTVWLSQKLMGELFDKDSDIIGVHLKNIFIEGELEEGATTEVFSAVQMEVEYGIEDAIVADTTGRCTI